MLKGHAVKRLGKKAAILNLREHIKNKLFLDRTRKDSNFKRPHICATLFQIEKCWGPLQRLGADVDQIDVKARYGADMGNPAANLAGSNYADFPDGDRWCCCHDLADLSVLTQLTTSVAASSSAVLRSITPPTAGRSRSARASGLSLQRSTSIMLNNRSW